MEITHGSLFTGIGGIDLGFEWAGIETKWQVEIDDYCQKLLSIRFPHTEKFTDVRKVGSHNLEKVDIISGGFPCQDISIAGRGEGIEGARSGLWSELHRVISELRPRFAFIENVPMLTIRGGTRVISDLAEIGYDAEWQIVGADDVGAWHRRKRIWIVAYPQNDGSRGDIEQRQNNDYNKNGQFYEREKKGWNEIRGVSKRSCKDVPDTNNPGIGTPKGKTNKNREKRIKGREIVSRSEPSGYGKDDAKRLALNTDTDSLGSHREKIDEYGEIEFSDKQDRFIGSLGRNVSRSKDDGREKKKHVPDATTPRPQTGAKSTPGQFRAEGAASWWAVEPDVGRVAHGVPSRVDRLKGVGNAVVPHIPYIIGKRLKGLCEKQ